MASFVQNGFYLVSISGMENQVGFVGTDSNSALLVAFHPISGNQVSTKPSSSLCPLTNYAVRVILPNDSTIRLLSPGSSSTEFTLTDGFVSNPNSLVQFEPINQSARIISFQPFSANLRYSGQKFSDEYIVEPRPDFQEAGYTQELPTLLNNCNQCGCPSGSECYANGQCSVIVDVCPPDAICGQNKGLCSGPCFASNGRFAECRNISGGFQCVPSDTYSSWTFLAIILVVAAFLAFGFYLLGMSFYRSNKPIIEEYQYERAGPPQYQTQQIMSMVEAPSPDGCGTVQVPQYQTVTSVNQPVRPVVEPIYVDRYAVRPVSTVLTRSTPEGIRSYASPSEVPTYEAQRVPSIEPPFRS